ncbi:hypothetical protein [Chamaesiphon polymorphus]|uniref:Uncharacterized protein n=1 Tax=Chamaesiphon polymorphus CCALA 037 TaxID=2107692 RepID=A0A2T1FEH3_9CYAN|nr:hypothetical protein [Chamaesiphon polymorphus]PSB43351.1 hypothetical protein C7B77_26195 [Chamaesiphon polymorphus CCALA 037]
MDNDKGEWVSTWNIYKQIQHSAPEGILAWDMYPAPDGQIYTSEDLKSLKCVEGLFDLCQILNAIIYRDGWKFLVETHGIDRLLEVDKISGWFFDNTFDELRYHCLIVGYDPVTGFIGDYDENTGIFLPEQGGEYQTIWGSYDSEIS